MPTERSRLDTRLDELLAAGDPARGHELSEHDARTIRRRVLAASAQDTRRRSRLEAHPVVTAMAATVLVALAAGLLWWSVPDRTTRPEVLAAVEAREAREIQFVTDGGTLVVWVLDPGFRP